MEIIDIKRNKIKKPEGRKHSVAGTWTRVSRVRAEYPNQLDYNGLLKTLKYVLIVNKLNSESSSGNVHSEAKAPFVCRKVVFFWKVNSGENEFLESEFRESIFWYLTVLWKMNWKTLSSVFCVMENELENNLLMI